MFQEILPLLSCPCCKKCFSLFPAETENEEITEGYIECEEGHRYPIRKGVLHMGSEEQADSNTWSDYYQDMSYEERCHLNYDEPFIFDHDLLYQDICTLMEGKPISRKLYDFSQHARADDGILIYPSEVLIVEGIHAFYDKRLCDKMYLKLYISVEPDICLL